MKNAIAGIFIAFLSSSAWANNAPAVPSPYVSSQPGLEVSAHHGQIDGTFEITAVFSDTNTGQVLASPKMTVRAGQWAQVSIGDSGGTSAAIALSATVDPSGHLVAFLADASQADGDRRTFIGTSFVSP